MKLCNTKGKKGDIAVIMNGSGLVRCFLACLLVIFFNAHLDNHTPHRCTSAPQRDAADPSGELVSEIMDTHSCK